MDEKTFKPFNWRLPLYGVLAGLFVPLPTILFGINEGIFLTMLLGPIAFITLLIVVRETRRQVIASLVMLVVFFAVCLALSRVSEGVRTVCRWALHKNAYKAEVLVQPSSTNSSLKHVEWDGWGWITEGDTVVYLVFDPNDSLASAARIGAPGKFSGIPCEVAHVRRLEHQWYTVQFNTDTDWEHCQ